MHDRPDFEASAGRWRWLATALLVCLVAVTMPGRSASAAETGTPSPTPTQAATPQMIPPPTAVTPRAGEWQPGASTRILIADEALAAEGARLADEFAELGLIETQPQVALLADPSLATPDDVILTLGDDATLSTPDTDTNTTQALTATGPDAAGIFRVTRPLLQQLAATGDLPGGTYEFTFPEGQIRAAHLDIARKHYPLETLKAFVTQLSWLGFTELELHFSENEGFAIESTTHPDIASAEAHSQEEIRELIDFANGLHVRVAPSLDMPGHLDHALDAYPELRLRDAGGGEVFGALDITTDAATQFAHDLIGEFTELFEQPDMPGPTPWNLGADEFVNFASEGEVQALTQAAQAKFGAGATAYDELTDFVNTTATMLADAGYQPRVWSDGMLRASVVDLDPDVQVAYWTQRPPGAVPASEFAAQGYELVNVNDEFLYFVLGERVGYAYPTGEAILAGWDETVFPSVQGSPDLVDASAGGMLAIWGDIPDALTADAVVERVCAPLAAMAVKFVDPATTLSFGELTSILDAIGDAPAVAPAAAPDSLETLAPTSTPAPEPSATHPGATTEIAPQWLLLGGAAILALTAVVLVAVARRRR